MIEEKNIKNEVNKFTLRMNDYLLNMLDEECEKTSISRNALINICVKKYFDEKEAMKNIPKLLYLYNNMLEEDK